MESDNGGESDMMLLQFVCFALVGAILTAIPAYRAGRADGIVTGRLRGYRKGYRDGMVHVGIDPATICYGGRDEKSMSWSWN